MIPPGECELQEAWLGIRKEPNTLLTNDGHRGPVISKKTQQITGQDVLQRVMQGRVRADQRTDELVDEASVDQGYERKKA